MSLILKMRFELKANNQQDLMQSLAQNHPFVDGTKGWRLAQLPFFKVSIEIIADWLEKHMVCV